jgi:hypothetical protein
MVNRRSQALKTDQVAQPRAGLFHICADANAHRLLFCMIFSGTLFTISRDAMQPIKLRVPREEAADLADDLTAWTATSGVDPGLTIFNEPGATTNASSPILYLVHVDESFFDQFPKWRMYFEQ